MFSETGESSAGRSAAVAKRSVQYAPTHAPCLHTTSGWGTQGTRVALRTGPNGSITIEPL
ncbi:hypothetical protein [Streptomyces sp. NPDC017086]|uniref:hypothetical protein n=1 Tax=Streptomyces sp. NPDC017086 TaxID=3364976 RepID=UPI0037A8ED27